METGNLARRSVVAGNLFIGSMKTRKPALRIAQAGIPALRIVQTVKPARRIVQTVKPALLDEVGADHSETGPEKRAGQETRREQRPDTDRESWRIP
ncbi:MAG: hypothetical protein ACLRZZ_21625 [Enterocloster sp.]